MPSSYVDLYFPVLVQVVIAVAVACGLIGVSALLGKKAKSPQKDMPYESGMIPVGSARERFSVKFYLVGMVFILFDIEAIFLYPWAVVYRQLKLFGFFEMLIFIALVLIGFFYVWRKGALNWSYEEAAGRKSPKKRALEASATSEEPVLALKK
jgi:NADH-quinone oxidoreductase subunit A